MRPAILEARGAGTFVIVDNPNQHPEIFQVTLGQVRFPHVPSRPVEQLGIQRRTLPPQTNMSATLLGPVVGVRVDFNVDTGYNLAVRRLHGGEVTFRVNPDGTVAS